MEWRERRETADYLTGKVKGLVKTVKGLRTGRAFRQWRRRGQKVWKDPVKWGAKALPEAWLEYRYALSPMILSVFDAVELLHKANQNPPIVRFESQSVEDGTSSETATTRIGGMYSVPASRIRVSGEHKSVQVVLYMSPKDFLYKSLNDAGVLNPAMTTWESIPFSFVADWFVGVGDYLNASAALSLYSLRGGTATHRHTWRNTGTYTFIPDGAHVHCSGPTSYTVDAGGSSFQRVILDDGDLVPRFHAGDGLNLLRAADAVSLAAGLLRGSKFKSWFSN
jgi:hypothetical protein